MANTATLITLRVQREMRINCFAALAACLVVGCGKDKLNDHSRSGGAARPQSMTAASPAADSASEALEQYLALSIATVKPTVAAYTALTNDSDCWMNINTTRRLWVADYAIESLVIAGDTATARVALTSVAEQTEVRLQPDEGLYQVQRGVRTDTATWHLIRANPPQSGWRVCGDALERFSVFAVGRRFRWLPDGFSEAEAFKLVDSVRVARSLERVR